MSITASKFFSITGDHPPREVEDRFFTDLRTRNSTFKRTSSHRFIDLDKVIVENFQAMNATIRRVLDIGVSSGSTTLALSDMLRRGGFDAHVTGTDLSLDGHLVSVAPGVRVLTDDEGHPLQYDILGLTVRPWGRRADYGTGMVAVRAALNAVWGKAAQRRLKDAISSGIAVVSKDRARDIKTVRLLSPRLSGHSEITMEANDIFAATDRYIGNFDFIRAANILNRGYFKEDALRCALANIVRYLSGPGAWLLVARSTQGMHVSTLFRVCENGKYLEVIDRFGGGSEIEWLVLATPLPAAWAK
jgi:SAM-dependent methyltransferase